MDMLKNLLAGDFRMCGLSRQGPGSARNFPSRASPLSLNPAHAENPVITFIFQHVPMYNRLMPTQNCLTCKTDFEISKADEDYYKKRAVPHPKLCPKHRLQRRLAFRNERSLFRRRSDKSGKEIISNIRPESPVPVYHVDEWHKDDWSPPFLPKYDFNQKFFEQFARLSPLSPRQHLALGGNTVNSDYINHAGNCKNCYFIFNSEYDEDCMYCKLADHCRDCVDSTNIFHSELCYECVNVENCYRLFFSDDCKTCRDSVFLRFCRGVSNSIFCYGLEQKQYHIFNQPYSKEDFFKKLQDLQLHTYTGLQNAIKTWKAWSKQFPPLRQIILPSVMPIGNPATLAFMN